MKDKDCRKCVNQNACKSGFTSWLFFIIGIIAAISIRIVTFLYHLTPAYAKISWYVGVGGFFIFFVYKFIILRDNTKRIKKQHILEKLDRQEKLSAEDFNLLHRILCDLSSKKEQTNYLFIFVLSAMALAIAVYFDFFK